MYANWGARIPRVFFLAVEPEMPHLRHFLPSCVEVWRWRLREDSLSVTLQLPPPQIQQQQKNAFFLYISTELWGFVWKPPAGVNSPAGDLFTSLLSLFLSLWLHQLLSRSVSSPPPSSRCMPLCRDRQGGLLRWHFYKDVQVNYDPGSRLAPKTAHVI